MLGQKKKGTKPNKVFGGPNSGSLQEHHAHALPWRTHAHMAHTRPTRLRCAAGGPLPHTARDRPVCDVQRAVLFA